MRLEDSPITVLQSKLRVGECGLHKIIQKDSILVVGFFRAFSISSHFSLTTSFFFNGITWGFMH